MTIHTMKNTSFKKVNDIQWKEFALQSLKGKTFESLITKTAEGIELQPLYSESDFLERLTTIRPLKEKSGWTIAQQTYATDCNDFIERLYESIKNGNESVFIDDTTQFEWCDEALVKLATLLKKYPVYILSTSPSNPLLTVFDIIPENERSAIHGVVSIQGWNLPVGYVNIRTLGADLWDAHHKGADAVTELALTLSLAAQHAEKSYDFNQFTNAFFVRLAVDTHFFMEIAKFRAFRILWQAFGSAYGQNIIEPIPILATTSMRSYSKLDPYVNLLRAGNETFSAAMGGADIITVHPHDILTNPTSSSIRYARNLQLVIKEETHTSKVLDPAGGSYFIETLTSELVEKAWTSFLTIEKNGGYNAFLSSGALNEQLEKRFDEVATGTHSLIGTNGYAELVDASTSAVKDRNFEGRLAKPFEELRTEFAINQPKTVLLTFGELKDFKQKADFVTGFLATGGLQAFWSPEFSDVSSAMDWLDTEKPDYVVICASTTSKPDLIDEVLQHRKSSIKFDVAGKYDASSTEKWLAKGLNGFIYKGQNRIDKLKTILQHWQGGEWK